MLPRMLLSGALVLVAACGSPTPQAAPPQGEPPPAEATEAPPEAPPTPPPLRDARGIDVSHHSGAVDWAAVAAGGYAFAYVKATEGIDAPDPTFDEHWQALADHGLHRGAYHFYVTEDDPEEQARFFLSHVRHRPGDLAPVVDVELIGHGTVGDVAPRLRRFLEIVEQEVGVPPIIYTGNPDWHKIRVLTAKAIKSSTRPDRRALAAEVTAKSKPATVTASGAQGTASARPSTPRPSTPRPSTPNPSTPTPSTRTGNP